MESYGRFNGIHSLFLLTHLAVFVRIRPVLPQEVDNQYLLEHDKREAVQVSKNGKEVILYKDNSDPRRFNFDYVLNNNVNQILTYKYVAEGIVKEVLEGYNGTIMAYGQTGSGKTFTIFGPKKSMNVSDEDFAINKESGIVFRSLSHVFDFIQANNHHRQFRVSLSFFQIYLENIQDLLISGGQAKDNLQIREDPKNGIYVEGLTQKSVKSLFEVLHYIKDGVKNRMTSATNMNKASSRSHAVLQLTIEQRWIEESDEYQEETSTRGRAGRSLSPHMSNQKAKKKHIKKSLLSLVDLAGSERLSKSNSDGLRFEEAKTINKSIATLGNCIAALAQEKKKGFFPPSHVPFRDSKLTRILSDCLGGNAKTSICACVAPTALNSEETFSTLYFASRAMAVKINPKLNENVYLKTRDNSVTMSTAPDERSFIDIETNKKLKEEVDMLRQQLAQRDSSPISNGLSHITSNKSLILPESVLASNNNSMIHNSRMFDPFRRDGEYGDVDESRRSKISGRYEKPFMLIPSTKENMGSDNERGGYSKKEQELIKRYAGIIEALQSELTQKEARISELKDKVERYVDRYGEI